MDILSINGVLNALGARFQGRFTALASVLVILALGLPPVKAGAHLPKVLLVSPEQTGVLQTGGLAHAVGGLAKSLNSEGLMTDVLMPYFLEMNSGAVEASGHSINVNLDWRGGKSHKVSKFSVQKNKNRGNPTIFLKHENAADQKNYFDNRRMGSGPKFYGPEATIGESFGAFAKAAADYILTQDYDVVVLNDWTTGLIAMHLQEAKKRGVKVPKVVFAIHNIAYQGVFPHSLSEFLGLDPGHFQIEGYEYYGQMSFLKAGLQFSDLTYTVSKQYAKEISTPKFGAGLDGVIRRLRSEKRMLGILNGITEEEWDPSLKVDGLPWTFTPEDMGGKGMGKLEIQRQMGLPVVPELPVFIMTSRLAEQKGLEYMIDAVEVMATRGESQWIVIGDGDAGYEKRLRDLEARFPKFVRYRPYSDKLERLLTRYGDFFVNGAWFEPSGLNQLFALLNGTIPIASRVGGLVDSIKEDETGFLFPIIAGQNGAPYDRAATRDSAVEAFTNALKLFENRPHLHQVRLKGMAEKNSWNTRVTKDFLPLFRDLMSCEKDLSSAKIN